MSTVWRWVDKNDILHKNELSMNDLLFRFICEVLRFIILVQLEKELSWD